MNTLFYTKHKEKENGGGEYGHIHLQQGRFRKND